MKSSFSQLALFIAGTMFIIAAIMPPAAQHSLAAPAPNISETVTEPPPPPPPPTTAVPPTAVPPTVVPPTAVPPTAVPPTAVPPTTEPPTAVPSTSEAPDERADPAITKSVSPTAVRVGDLVTYQLLVENNGNAPARNVVVQDTLPGFMSIVLTTATRGTIAVDGNTIVWSVDNMGSGERITISISVRITAMPPEDTFINVARLTTDSGSDRVSNNSSTARLEVLPDLDEPTATATPTGAVLIAPSATPTSADAQALQPSPPSQQSPLPQQPTSTPRPARLPQTSDPGSMSTTPILLISGVILIVLSLFIHVGRLRRR